MQGISSIVPAFVDKLSKIKKRNSDSLSEMLEYPSDGILFKNNQFVDTGVCRICKRTVRDTIRFDSTDFKSAFCICPNIYDAYLIIANGPNKFPYLKAKMEAFNRRKLISPFLTTTGLEIKLNRCERNPGTLYLYDDSDSETEEVHSLTPLSAKELLAVYKKEKDNASPEVTYSKEQYYPAIPKYAPKSYHTLTLSAYKTMLKIRDVYANKLHQSRSIVICVMCNKQICKHTGKHTATCGSKCRCFTMGDVMQTHFKGCTCDIISKRTKAKEVLEHADNHTLPLVHLPIPEYMFVCFEQIAKEYTK